MNRPDHSFIEEMKSLQRAYLASPDPMMQSGYSGGRERWVAERSPIVRAIEHDGDFLDVGCANGLLAEDVVAWAAERGQVVIPFGVDLGASLVALARERLPMHASNFFAADAWMWDPGRTWDFVFSLIDLAPGAMIGAWLERLAHWVKPGGRLIIASYGSRSRIVGPDDVASALQECGYSVDGVATGGDPPIANFAWTDL